MVEFGLSLLGDASGLFPVEHSIVAEDRGTVLFLGCAVGPLDFLHLAGFPEDGDARRLALFDVAALFGGL
ncbi:MAG: hypothetical protein WC277_10530, partial [Bacilli bacterium]